MTICLPVITFLDPVFVTVNKEPFHVCDWVMFPLVWLVVQNALLYQGHCNGQAFICPCDPGYYVIANCSKLPDGRLVGVQCKECSKCTAEDQITNTSCSKFADSVCGCVDGARKNSSGLCEKHGIPDSPDPEKLNYVMISTVSLTVILLVVLVAVLCKVLTCLHPSVYNERCSPRAFKPFPGSQVHLKRGGHLLSALKGLSWDRVAVQRPGGTPV